MKTIKKLIGNYSNVFRQSYYDSAIIESLLANHRYQKALNTILVDLPRVGFFETNGKTFTDLIAAWIKPSISTAYNQGNIDGGFFNLMITASNDFYFEKDLRTEEMHQSYFISAEMFSLRLAYFDDDGIPCALMFHGARFDRDTWTAAIIRNTTAEPNDREVMLLCSEDIIKPALITEDDNPQTFDGFLNSQLLSAALDGIFLENNQLNIKQIDELNKKLVHPTPAQRGLLDKKKQQLDALNDDRLQKIDKDYYQNKRTQLETQVQQLNGHRSFVSRQLNNLLGAVTMLGIAVALLLAVTGVLAPLGIVFTASVVSYGIISALAFSIAAVAFITKMISSEQSLSDLHHHLAKNNKQEATLNNLLKAFQSNYHDLSSREDKKEAIAKYLTVHDLDDDVFFLLCKSLLDDDVIVLNSSESSIEPIAPSTTKLRDWHNTPPALLDHQHGLRLLDEHNRRNDDKIQLIDDSFSAKP